MFNHDEYFGGTVQMAEQKSDLPSVLQQVRIARLKLGNVLDQLETFEPGREALEQLLDLSDCIAADVDSLNDIVRQLMGK